jgi:hyperosmotically inducible protein
MTTVSRLVTGWLRTPLLICAAGSLMFVSAQSSTNTAPKAPDNTATNKSQSAKPTAEQQNQNRSDLQVTQKIRKLIEGDKKLSTYAKNVKIVTQSGDVTLTGPVRSEDEKKSIEAKAIEVAGTGHVKNQLQIASSSAKTATNATTTTEKKK